jgi:hypothetical protein
MRRALFWLLAIATMIAVTAWASTLPLWKIFVLTAGVG